MNLDDLKAAIEKENKEVEARYELCRTYIAGTHRSKAPVPEHIRLILSGALANGYRAYRGSKWDSASNPFMLAKSFENERGDRLYQICIDFWDLAIEYRQHTTGVSLRPNSQFYLHERRGPDSRTVDLESFIMETDSLEKIEAFFARFYQAMDCVPYETVEER